MKRFALIFAISIALTIEAQAQIPNSGFETWKLSGSCLKPQGWAGLNDWMGLTENCYSYSRSEDHYPASVGSYSIKIENRPSLLPDWGAAGLVWSGDSTGLGADGPVFAVNGHPNCLCGYYKFLPQNGDTMDIHFVLYKNGVDIAMGTLLGHTTVAEWTSFKIPLSNPNYVTADSARIMMSAFYSDSFVIHGNSVLYVDNLSFDTLISSVGSTAAQKALFSLFPNPCRDNVKVDFAEVIHFGVFLQIYNLTGVLVKSQMLMPDAKAVDIGDLSNGIYLVVVRSADRVGQMKLVVQR